MRTWWLLRLCFGTLLLGTRCQEEEHDPNIESEQFGDEGDDDSMYAEPDEPTMSEWEELLTDDKDAVYARSQLTIEQMQGLHGKIDQNGDGKITMPEVIAFSIATRKAIAEKDSHGVLHDMDADKDGKVSRSEFYDNQFAPTQRLEDTFREDPWAETSEKAVMDGGSAQMHRDMEMQKFDLADQNGDGFLVVQELPAVLYPDTHDGVLQLTAAFTLKLKDKDEDGELSQDELWEVDKSEDQSAQDESDRKQSDAFKKLDKDQSGKLNIEEIKAWESGAFHTSESMKELFAKADMNKDHHITLEEFKGSQDPISAAPDVASQLFEWADHHEL